MILDIHFLTWLQAIKVLSESKKLQKFCQTKAGNSTQELILNGSAFQGGRVVAEHTLKLQCMRFMLELWKMNQAKGELRQIERKVRVVLNDTLLVHFLLAPASRFSILDSLWI